jgi:high-affinity iron transporter
MAAALLSFREGLEAALIVGIILSYLAKAGQSRQARLVWAGVLSAAAASVLSAAMLTSFGAEMAGPAEQIFEGATMLAAAVILTWMVFWMQDHGGQVKGKLEERVSGASASGGRWALFSLAFVSVLREGIELALFLVAAVFATSAAQTIMGAVAGLAAAVVVGWLFFAGTRRLNLRRFFAVTSVLLLIFAAGLLARSVGEFQEAGLLPSLVDHVWSTQSFVSSQSTLGEILGALFGYTDSPSLLQVLVYVGYLSVVGSALVQRSRHTPAAAQQAPGPAA